MLTALIDKGEQAIISKITKKLFKKWQDYDIYLILIIIYLSTLSNFWLYQAGNGLTLL